MSHSNLPQPWRLVGGSICHKHHYHNLKKENIHIKLAWSQKIVDFFFFVQLFTHLNFGEIFCEKEKKTKDAKLAGRETYSLTIFKMYLMNV